MMSVENDASRFRRKPNRTLLILAGPITVSMMSYSLMTLADTLFVSGLGATSLAAVGFGGVLAFAIVAFPMGFLRASKIIVSQAVGAGDEAKAQGALSAALVFAMFFGALSLVTGLLVSEVLQYFTANQAVGALSGEYLWVRLLASPWVLAFVALREFRYGRGDTRVPMIATVLGNLVNIALDAVFILVLDTGAIGAAYATALAQAIQFLVLYFVQRRRGFGFVHLARSHIFRLLRVGAPTGIQFLLEVMSFSLMAAILATLNELELASHQIAIQLTHFVFLPCAGICEASGVIAGQLCGQRRYEDVLACAKRALVWVLAYCLLGSLVFIFAPQFVLQFFGDDPLLQEKTTSLLKVAALFQVFDGALVVAYFTLRGTGDVKVPAAIAVICAWVFTPTLTWLLGVHYGLGAKGAWIGLCCEIMAIAVLLWWRLLAPYRKGFSEVGWVKVAKRVLDEA